MTRLLTTLNHNFPGTGEKLEKLQSRIDYRFTNIDHLLEAMTHSSAARSYHHRKQQQLIPWNERLEFLGDSVLGLAISTWLLKHPYAMQEGELSRIRSSLVNEKTLAVIANQFGIGSCLLLSKGEEKNGGRQKNSVTADAVESLIGAIYLDGGFAAAEKVVSTLFADTLTQDLSNLLNCDYKTRLQELTQSLVNETPDYQVIEKSGPDHEALFKVVVSYQGSPLGTGLGKTKKAASQQAAYSAFNDLGEGKIIEILKLESTP